MLSRQFIMTVVVAAALALAFSACAAQAQSPLAAQDHHKRGLALGQSGELDLAIAEFDKAIELSPLLADAWCNRGIAYISKGDPDRAMADLGQAIALDPRHSMAHYNRGVILQSRGEADKAMADFNRAIEFDHRFAEAYTNRGKIHNDGRIDLTLGLRRPVERRHAPFGADKRRHVRWFTRAEATVACVRPIEILECLAEPAERLRLRYLGVAFPD